MFLILVGRSINVQKLCSFRRITLPGHLPANMDIVKLILVKS